MKIVEVYEEKFNNFVSGQSDFCLAEVYAGILVGVDKYNNTVVVLKSYQPSKTPVMQKSRMISIECNARVTYTLEGAQINDIVHIIRCFTNEPKERIIFLELSGLFVDAASSQNQEEFILELFSTLSTFFSNRIEMSDRELRGLYAELYTIRSFEDDLHLSQYWQSKDKMKFDFSLTSNVKLEIKSTLKNERRHHFKHEQLICTSHNIYILSYLLRPDDEGLSMYDLIVECKELLSKEPEKALRLINVIKDVSEQRLRDIKFDEDYIRSKRKFYKASDIPRFDEQTPEGVANAEYDCLLDNINSIMEDDVLKFFKNIVEQTEKVNI